LKWLRAQSDLPWLCGGDFNEILDNSEYFGLHERQEWQMAGFREVVDVCDFHDLGFSGVPFTWDNGQNGEANVKVRLDRMLADPEFLALYGSTTVRHIPTPKSDHCMLAVKIQKLSEPHVMGGPRPFMYEDAWQREEGFMQAMGEGWQAGAGAGGLVGLNDALMQMQTHLSDWSSKKFGDIRKRIKKVRKQFEKERAGSLYRGISTREKELARQLADLLRKEEIMARQRSRVQWLKEGDRNTAFDTSQTYL
jgi:hypothetical protein